MNYDNTCKYLAEQYPAEFVSWLLAVQPQDIQVLKTELTLAWIIHEKSKSARKESLKRFRIKLSSILSVLILT